MSEGKMIWIVGSGALINIMVMGRAGMLLATPGDLAALEALAILATLGGVDYLAFRYIHKKMIG